MALSTELLKRLNKKEEELSRRLCLARNAFQCTEIHIHQKEQLVLHWLCDYGMKEHSVEVWKTLQACLSSNRMLSLGTVDIRGSTKSFITKVLSECLKTYPSEDVSYAVLLQCTIHVLENSKFQQYFKKELSEYITLQRNFFSAVAKINNSELFTKAIESVQSFSKQNLQVEQFCALFIQELLFPLIEAHSVFSHANNLDVLMLKCIQQVMFSKTSRSGITECMSSLFGSTSPGTLSELLLHHLAVAVTNLTDNSVVNLYSIVFKAFVTRYKNNKTAIYEFFVILCFLIGFKIQCKSSDTGNKFYLLCYKNFKKSFQNEVIPKPGKVNATSLHVLKSLINIIIESNIQLDTLINEVSFMDCLQALVFSLVSKTDITPDTFDVLCCIIRFNPLVIEPKIDLVLENVLLIEKNTDEMRQSYISFLHCVIEMFVKLYRLHKLIAKLLPTLHLAITKKTLEERVHLKLLDVLPNEICTKFQNSLPTIPSVQTIAMARTFTYHLVQDCVTTLENTALDAGSLLYLQVIGELLSQFLRGVRMADHTVPAPVVERFVRALQGLRDVLGRLGTAMLHKEHCRALMVAYLNMCYSCGELQVLLMHYSIQQDTKLVSFLGDTSAINFEYLHSYLNSEQWSLVAERISNFGEAACKEQLNKLVFQKLRVAVLFSGEMKDSSNMIPAIAKHVTNNISETWSLILCSDATTLVPVLSVEQLVLVANHVVHMLTIPDGQQINILDTPAIQESRPLVVAFIWAVLQRICRLFVKTKRKRDVTASLPSASSQLVRDVLLLLDSQIVLETKDIGEALPPVIATIAARVTEACEKCNDSTSSLSNGSVLNVASLEAHLKILKRLPIRYMSRNVQTVAALSVLTVAIVMNATSFTEHPAPAKELCMELLLGMLDGPNPPLLADFLHVGHLTRWLLTANLSPIILHPLLQRLFDMSLRHTGSLQQLGAGVQLLDKKAHKFTCSTTSLQAATLLLRTLKRSKKRRLDIEDHLLYKKYQRRLSQGIIGFMERTKADMSLTPSHEMLESFNLALQSYLMRGGKKLNKVTPHIQTFVQAALCDLSTFDISPQHAAAYVVLMGSLLRHKDKLGGCLPEDFVPHVWALLSNPRMAGVERGHIVQLLRVASPEELVEIVCGLLERTRAAYTAGEHTNLEAAITLWKCVSDSSISGTKNEATLLEVCHMLCDVLSQNNMQGLVVPIFELFLSLVQRRQLHPQLVDVFLQTIAATPLQSLEALPAWLAAAGMASKLLTAMLVHHRVLLVDRIPAMLQCHQHIMVCLVERSDQRAELGEQHVTQLATCAHGIERMTNVMVKLKEHFARVSPYVIANMLYQFEKYTIYPAIKFHLLNCVYSLLRLCDSHAISHLLQALTPASKEIFKTAYSNYKKYYRFTGKV